MAASCGHARRPSQMASGHRGHRGPEVPVARASEALAVGGSSRSTWRPGTRGAVRTVWRASQSAGTLGNQAGDCNGGHRCYDFTDFATAAKSGKDLSESFAILLFSLLSIFAKNFEERRVLLKEP